MADQPNTLLSEDFEGAEGETPPPGWTQVAGEDDTGAATWLFDPVGNPAPFEGNAAYFFDLAPIEGEPLEEIDASLVSPVFDASGAEEAYLLFDQEFQARPESDEQGGSILIELTTDGEEWTTVFSDDRAGFFDPESRVVEVTDVLAGAAEAQLRLRFDGNESVFWAVDNVALVDGLTPGVTGPDAPVRVSESAVPDPRTLEFALASKPTADVTISFVVDGEQLQEIEPLVFAPEDWTETQTAVARAVDDGAGEGDEQESEIEVVVTSDDPDYDGTALDPIPVEITERVIPGFESYRTVEATYADMAALAEENPELATWTDIGDSYDKVTEGGPEGYDLYALKLTNEETDDEVDKPVFFVQAAIHAREYTTAELVARFAEDLVDAYGTRAEVTWLLDNYEVHVVPILNPDGRKFAEQGYLWRKNTNPNPPPGEDPAPFPDYGVDLNRNYDSQFGQVPGGSSGDPASAVYRGEFAFSEPESQAARDYILEVFPDQRDDPDEPVSDDATGVYLDVHSFGSLILYPGGITEENRSPDQEELRQLGLKFGYFTGLEGEAYNVQTGDELYETDGTTDAWVYETLGVAAFTPELGTEFFEDVDYFEDVIMPEFTPVLYYAAKAAQAPYRVPFGPDAVDVSVDAPTVYEGQTVTLTALADATRFDDGPGEFDDPDTEPGPLPEFPVVGGARYSIDAPSWIEGTQTFEMEAADGAFDATVEGVTASVDTAGLEPGRHTLFVEAQAEDGTYGVPTAVFMQVLDAGDGVSEIVLSGEGGSDTLTGTDGDDVVSVGDADGPFAGGLGSDVITGTEGDDVIRGDLNRGSKQQGRDGGDDVIYGLGGDDRIGGKSGDDVIYGGDGDDRLYGDGGDDVLRGGEGRDVLKGDGGSTSGSDTFVLATGEGLDVVRDFNAGEDLLGLAGELTFRQLDFVQTANATRIELDGERIAKLTGISVEDVSEDWFVPL